MRFALLAALLLPLSAAADDGIRAGLNGGMNVDTCGTLVDGITNDGLAIRSPDLFVGLVQLLGSNEITLSYTVDGEAQTYTVLPDACDWDAEQDNNNSDDTIVLGRTPELEVALLVQLTRQIDVSGDEQQRTHAYSLSVELRNRTGAAIDDVDFTWALQPDDNGEVVTGDVFSSSFNGDTRTVATVSLPESNTAVGVVACLGGDAELAADTAAATPASADPDGGATSDALRFAARGSTVPAGGVSALSFGVVTASADADDAVVSVDPGVFETCDRDDEDDSDGDGFLEPGRGGTDCDDTDPAVGAGPLYWRDADGDGFGNPEDFAYLCSSDDDYVLASAGPADCDDGEAQVNPGATEAAASGIDLDCDGLFTCYVDADSDEAGASDGSTTTSDDPDCLAEGVADNTLDCDDDDAAIGPTATELAGNTVDEDCDGELLCYVDADGDGYGNPDGTTVQSDDLDCDDEGEALLPDDCDDADAAISPGAAELPGNEVDEDCDGAVACYADADGDGFFGEEGAPSEDDDCADEGEATTWSDCDDSDASVNPDAVETVGNEVDENCDGQIECWDDFDDDGFGSMDVAVLSDDMDCLDEGESEDPSDCNDADASIHPDADEVPGNGIDENCDGEDVAVEDDEGYWGGGRTRCSVVGETPALGGLTLLLLGLLARRRREV